MALIDDIRAEVEKRSRFSQILALVEPPTPDEIDAAIFDTVDEINSVEPQTHYTFEEMASTMTDKRWKRLLLLGSSKNTVQMLIHDWTANGLDVDLGDGVALQSKLSDYSSLHDLLKTEFDELLEKLKTSSQKFSRVSTFTTTIGLGAYSSFGKRSRLYRKAPRV